MDRYALCEALGIHLLTGLLFLVASGLFLWLAATHSLWLLLVTVAITLCAAGGWWFQARFFAGLIRGDDPRL